MYVGYEIHSSICPSPPRFGGVYMYRYAVKKKASKMAFKSNNFGGMDLEAAAFDDDELEDDLLGGGEMFCAMSAPLDGALKQSRRRGSSDSSPSVSALAVETAQVCSSKCFWRVSVNHAHVPLLHCTCIHLLHSPTLCDCGLANVHVYMLLCIYVRIHWRHGLNFNDVQFSLCGCAG